MSLAARLDRIAAALGGDGEPGILFVYVDGDDVWHTADGEVITPTAIDPAMTVFVYHEVAAGSRPTIPHTEPI